MQAIVQLLAVVMVMFASLGAAAMAEKGRCFPSLRSSKQ